jgi:hypothetical protein
VYNKEQQTRENVLRGRYINKKAPALKNRRPEIIKFSLLTNLSQVMIKEVGKIKNGSKKIFVQALDKFCMFIATDELRRVAGLPTKTKN